VTKLSKSTSVFSRKYAEQETLVEDDIDLIKDHPDVVAKNVAARVFQAK